MAKELKGKVKESIWTKPVCTDESDGFRDRQRARRQFKEDCNRHREPVDVAAPDVIAEAWELGESVDDAHDPAPMDV